MQEITEAGGTATARTGDVTDQAGVKAVFDAMAADAPIDCLINNAGIAHVGNVLNTSEEDFDRVLSVNVKGVYNCLQAGVSHMKGRGGSIVNIASTVSVMAIDDRFAYSTSKGAVLSMTYAVARDFLDDKIRCNAILPARIHTPFVDGFIKKNYPDNIDEMFEKLSDAQPIGRMGKPGSRRHGGIPLQRRSLFYHRLPLPCGWRHPVHSLTTHHETDSSWPTRREKPGVLREDGTRVDVSAFGEDFGETFFGTDGPARLAQWLETQSDLPSFGAEGTPWTALRPAQQAHLHWAQLQETR